MISSKKDDNASVDSSDIEENSGGSDLVDSSSSSIDSSEKE